MTIEVMKIFFEVTGREFSNHGVPNQEIGNEGDKNFESVDIKFRDPRMRGDDKLGESWVRDA